MTVSVPQPESDMLGSQRENILAMAMYHAAHLGLLAKGATT